MKKKLLGIILLPFASLTLLAIPTINNEVNLTTQGQKSANINSLALENITYKEIELGQAHSGAVITDQNDKDYLYMWGWNKYGQIGDGTTTDRTKPVKITLPETEIKNLVLGSSYTGVITIDDNQNDHLYMWGDNRQGQLGNGSTSNKNKPQEILLPYSDIKDLALGTQHTGVAISNGIDDFLYMWGNNQYGQLGTGDNVNQLKPTRVNFAYNKIEALSFGAFHSGLVTNINSYTDFLYTWGDNRNGQLGIGNTTNQKRPVQVNLGSVDIDNISFGAFHSGAIIDNHRKLYMWGWNVNGQVGNNSRTNQTKPVNAFIPDNYIKDFDLGYYHSGAVSTDNNGNDHLFTWGKNSDNQLGNGWNNDLYTPQEIGAPKQPIKQLSLGNEHTSIIGDNHLYLWGRNANGQIGNGNTTNQIRPIEITI